MISEMDLTPHDLLVLLVFNRDNTNLTLKDLSFVLFSYLRTFNFLKKLYNNDMNYIIK